MILFSLSQSLILGGPTLGRQKDLNTPSISSICLVLSTLVRTFDSLIVALCAQRLPYAHPLGHMGEICCSTDSSEVGILPISFSMCLCPLCSRVFAGAMLYQCAGIYCWVRNVDIEVVDWGWRRDNHSSPTDVFTLLARRRRTLMCELGSDWSFTFVVQTAIVYGFQFSLSFSSLWGIRGRRGYIAEEDTGIVYIALHEHIGARVSWELEADAVTLLKRIRKFSMAQDIGARVVVHIFNMINFAIVKRVGRK
ncbi:hypothetical protein Tco_0949707 [Tanacetum coccineum]